MDDRCRGSAKSECWDDDFVTGLNADGPQRQVKGVRAGTDAEAVRYVHIAGPFMSQQFGFVASGESAAPHDAEHCIIIAVSQNGPWDERGHMEWHCLGRASGSEDQVLALT